MFSHINPSSKRVIFWTFSHIKSFHQIRHTNEGSHSLMSKTSSSLLSKGEIYFSLKDRKLWQRNESPTYQRTFTLNNKQIPITTNVTRIYNLRKQQILFFAYFCDLLSISSIFLTFIFQTFVKLLSYTIFATLTITHSMS